MSEIKPTSVANYNDELKRNIIKYEGDVRRIYVDSIGIPTMGIGFALFTRSVNSITHVETFSYRGGSLAALDIELTNLGINLNESDWLSLDWVLGILNDGYYDPNTKKWVVDLDGIHQEILVAAGNELNGVIDNSKNSFSFSLATENVNDLFDVSVSEAQTQLISKIGQVLFDKYNQNGQGSNELIALTSLALNNPSLIGAGLTSALDTGDRAEAWYQIRYYSNGGQSGGIAVRRFSESELFGLYDGGMSPSSINMNDAKDVYQMYTEHRERILDYELNFGEGAALGVNRRSQADATSMEDSFKPSYDLLIKKYVTDELVGFNPGIDFRDIQIANSSGDTIYGTRRDGYVFDSSTEEVAPDGLIRSDQNDLIIGQEGNDFIYGRGGSDVLHGGDGTDWIEGGTGNDFIFGGDDESDDVLLGQAGDDYIKGGGGGDWIEGGADADQLFGEAGDDEIYGDGGNDHLYGGTGSDHLYGGEGEDILYANSADDVAGSATDKNYLDGGAGLDILYGGAGDDTLVGNLEDDILDGGAGHDTYIISGTGGGHATIIDSGENTIIFNGQTIKFGYKVSEGVWETPDGKFTITQNSPLTITDENGNSITIGNTASDYSNGDFGITLFDSLKSDYVIPDTVNTFTGGFEYLDFDLNKDFIQTHYGTGQLIQDFSKPNADWPNFIYGTAGNDFIEGGGGSDTLTGGAGDDYILGGNNFEQFIPYLTHNATPDIYDVVYLNDHLDGGAGNDVLDGQDGSDQIYGGIGNDWLMGGAGSDFLFGDDGEKNINGGDDLLEGGVGGSGDTLSGGYGNDQLYADTKEDFATLFANDDGSVSTERDWLNGGEGDDLLAGNNAQNGLAGGGGNDVIIAGGGDDYIFGDADYDNNQGGTWKVTSDFHFPNAHGETDPISSGDDLIYAGSGNDIAWAGSGEDVVYGGDGNDTLLGEAGSDILFGEAGDDTLEGDANYINGALHGNDVLYGGAGNDILIGQGGRDHLYGGAGDDELIGDNSTDKVAGQFHDDDVLDGGDGNDRLFGYGGNDRLMGGAGDDYLVGDSTVSQLASEFHGDDRLDGGDGNDTLFGGAGNDQLIGGTGDDILFGDSGDIDEAFHGNDILSGGEGNDYLDGGAGDDSLAGGLGNDELWAGAGNDSLSGGAGDDQLAGEDGNDTLSGGAGIDTLYGQRGDDTLDGGEGDDIVSGGEGNDIVSGGAGNDQIFGGDGDDTLIGGEGDDLLVAEAGNDQLHGDIGDDRLYGGFGNDTINGGDGNDLVSGNEGDDIVSGGAGNDQVFGGDGNDTLYGGIGEDILIAGKGSDILDGGEGTDIYVYNMGDGVDVIRDSGSNTLRFANVSVNNISLAIGSLKITTGHYGDEIHIEGFDPDDPYKSIGIDRFEFFGGDVYTLEQLIDLGFDLTGTNGDDTIYGTAAEDRISGLAGNDTIIAKAGNDTIDGGTGADTMFGNSGDDTYIVDNAGDQVIEDLDEGHDKVESSISYTLTDNVEDLALTNDAITGTGNNLNNVIEGNAANNILSGEAGNDTLHGYDGYDVISGGAGYDALSGGAGNDQLDGGADNDFISGDDGDDILLGGSGNDSLSGGNGQDILDGGTGADFLNGGEGDDTYYVDNVNDRISEVGNFNNVNNPSSGINGGNDTVHSTVNYQASFFVENIILDGKESINAYGTLHTKNITGNDGDNDLYAYRLNGQVDNLPHFGSIVTLDTYLNNGVEERLLDRSAKYIYDHGLIYNAYGITHTAQEGATLIGGAGNDRLYGDLDNDTLIGGAGDDLLYGSGGADYMEGGTGNDTYIVDYSVRLSFNRGGFQTSYADTSFDTLVENVGEGIDTVMSNTNWVLGANFENLVLLDGTTPFDQDLDFYDQPGYTAAPTTGEGNSLDNTITGNQYGNILKGHAGNDTLYGENGYDTLDGGTGADIMYGGRHNDTYIVDNVGDRVIETEGGWIGGYDDHVKSSISYTLGSNVENLTLTGTENLNGSGNSLNNDISGNSGNNVLTGYAGSDNIYGNAGDDVLDGGSGYDYLNGGAGDDTLLGGADRDILDGGTGADVMNGGTGNDTYYVDNINDVAEENVNEGHDVVNATASHTLGANVEDLYLQGWNAINGTGNNLNNRIEGNYGNNVIDGQQGDDQLFGNWGNDTILGGEGNDHIDGGYGVDTMQGGTGNDHYIVDNTNDMIVENANEGVDSVEASSTYTLSDNVENLTLTGNGNIDATGNASDNVITGNDYRNTLSGLAGNDTIDGQSGNDIISGGEGDDVLFGGGEALDVNIDSYYVDGGEGYYGGNLNYDIDLAVRENDDIIDGGAGNDTIDGGSGDDTLIGGTGNDTLYGGDDPLMSDIYNLANQAVNNIDFDQYDGGEGYSNINVNDPSVTQIITNNDYLDGGAGDDNLDGGSGNDTLIGGEGNDILYGGDDTSPFSVMAEAYGYSNGQYPGYYDGGEGSSYGGYGGASIDIATIVPNNDYLDGGTGDDQLDGGSGNDILLGGEGNDLLVGGTGNDSLDGGTGIDNLIGGEGNDVLDGGLGLDSMAGGAGDDVYYVDGYSETVTVPGDPGTDPGNGGTDPDCDDCNNKDLFIQVDLDEHHDNRKGNEGLGNGYDAPPPGHDDNYNDYEGTSPGNPGSKDSDIQSADDYSASSDDHEEDSETDDSSSDTDEHTCSTDTDTTGTTNGGTIIGETATGGTEPVTTTVWHTDTVTENAGEGYDRVYSTASFALSENIEELHLVGNAAIDGTGNSGNNIITGNDAANRLDGGAGADTLTGGLGDDTYVIDSTGDQIIEQANAGNDTVESSISYSIANNLNLENLKLIGTEHINGTGNAGNNLLTGNDGDNTLFGGAGDDTLTGGLGNDTLVGGLGNDTYIIYSDQGVDVIDDTQGVNNVVFADGLLFDNVVARQSIVNGETLVSVRLADKYGNELADQGFDFVLNADGSSPISNFTFSDGSQVVLDDLFITEETYTGTKKDDQIFTDRNDDTIYAGKGDDLVHSGAGNDLLFGERGDDILFAAAGKDLLFGGDGEDSLYGSFGMDTLYGGEDEDILFGGSGNDLLLGGEDDDELIGGSGDDLLAGGLGDDEYEIGCGSDTIMYNKGDGDDEVEFENTSSDSNLTLSLGGGIRLDEISLVRDDNDLVIQFGNDDSDDHHSNSSHSKDDHHSDSNGSIVLDDWYESDFSYEGNLTLQVILEASDQFDAASADTIYNSNVIQFDLNELIRQYELQNSGNEEESPWYVADSLLDTHLASSDSEALGGDVAYKYGLGQTDTFDSSLVLSSLSDPKLGKTPQAVNISPVN